MNIPVLLAHGEGLLSFVAMTVLLAVVALVSLIWAAASFSAKSAAGNRKGHRFLLLALLCLFFFFAAPWFVQFFHLP
jgi:hypothetical protein